MYFEQFYLGCLAHASYMFGSQGEAVVVDPQRDVEIYLKAAGEHGVKILHIFETHLHADFVSGHKELAERTGAKIYIGARAGAKFTHVDLQDGFELPVGKAVLKVLETPGHTPESICLLITDKEKSSKPWAVLTGDTLFLDSIGRTDLPGGDYEQILRSIHDKLLPLDDTTKVTPGHGPNTTIGRERARNPFLQGL